MVQGMGNISLTDITEIIKVHVKSINIEVNASFIKTG
jgi:hypothetical protein